MGDGAHFWRNVGIIAGAHAALMIAFVHWGGAGKTDAAQQIVWLSGSMAGDANGGSGAVAKPKPEPVETPEPEEQSTIATAKSEIQLPVPTARPTETPRPIVKLSPVPVAKPAQTPKPVAKAMPRKPIARATPKPRPRPTAAEDDQENDLESAHEAIGKIAGAQPGGGGSGGSGAGGTSTRSETQWYGRMLHDRFHSAWDQPTTVVASGTKMSALVRVRIEKSGHVSRFEIIKPTGNVVVDESVRAVASKVMQLDPLPAGVGNGEHYDVTINFELNPEE